MRILIVDDTAFMRATVRQMIEHEGAHQIFEAENGVEAVQKYKIYKPDLVIMDISMPLMDGIEAVSHIKSMDPNADILICSLQGQRSNVMKAIQAGARGFLVKPIKADKLYAEIETSRHIADQRRLEKRSAEDVVVDDDKLSELDQLIAKTYQDMTEVTQMILEKNPSEDYLKGVERGYLEARREITMNMLRMSLGIEVIKQCVEISDADLEAFKKAYRI